MDKTFTDGFALSPGNSIVLWFREMVAGAGLAALADAVHIRITCNLGLITLESINAALNVPATVEVLATLLFDGINNPFTVEKGIGGVPAPTDGEYYVLGKGFLEDIAIDKPQSFTLATNLQLDIQKEGGSIFPVQASIIGRQPQWSWITLRTDIMDSTNDDGDVDALFGKSIDFSGKSTRAFLQRTAQGGTLLPESNTGPDVAHIKFEVLEGVASIENSDFQPGQNAPVTVMVKPSKIDGIANDIMTFTKDVAIV